MNEGQAPTRLCVLLACFTGAKRASHVRSKLNKEIRSGDDALLDEVILKVNRKGKAMVYDPRRTLAGALTPALTWGVFGLLVGGLKSLAIWAVIGAICGGLYAYYTEHLITKNELKRLGGQFPVDSSTIAAYVRGTDPQRLLSSVASYKPTTASVAAIAADLSAQVYRGAADRVANPAAPTGSTPAAPTQDAALNMLMVRFTGEHGARTALGGSGSEKHANKEGPEVELFIEANEHGRLRVIDPKTGTAAFSKGAMLGWALFGVAFGLIAGFAGDGGVLGGVESGLFTGVLWGIFGAVAGALYGMWAGRGVSARRFKALGDFVPADTSLVVAWAEGSLSQEAIKRWTTPGSESLLLRFNPIEGGVVLGV